MARVEIGSQAWGVLINAAGLMSGQSATLKNLDGTNATIWTAVTGGTSNTSALSSDTIGVLGQSSSARFVEDGPYTLTVPYSGGTITRRVEAVAGTGPVLRAGTVAEVTDALTKAATTPGTIIELARNTTYTITSSWAIPQGTSIRGGGRSTIIQANGCDAFVFDVSNYIGPQVFENFYLQGNGYTYTAVKALGDADAGRVQGITFRDVFISGFKRAFHLRSTHGWHLDHVTATYVWEGVWVAGQTILLTIDGGCEFSRDAATGTGSSRGFYVAAASDYNPGGTTTQGPEGMRIRDSTFFGFAIAVDQDHALDAAYEGLTLGLVGNTAFQANLTPGSLRLRDTWIGYDDGAVYGVRLVALGAANTSSVLIQAVQTDVESGKTADVNSIGIAVDSNQSNVSILDNNLAGNRLHDVRLNFAGVCYVQRNKCRSATAGASIQLVAFPGGPYHVEYNQVATNITEHASNTNRTVASAATITVPGGLRERLINVTGTTTITSITSTYPDDIVTLKFAGILTLTDGSNLKLAGNYVTTADDTITLLCDGTNWWEKARAVV